MIKPLIDKFAVNDPPLIRIAFREVVIYAERDERGFVHLSTCAEKQDASPFGRILQRLANLLYRMGDAIHPLRYQGRLRVVQWMPFKQRFDDKISAKPHTCQVNRLPVRAAHGHTSYQRFVLYKSFENWQRAVLDDIDIDIVPPSLAQTFFYLGEVPHIGTLDGRHDAPWKAANEAVAAQHRTAPKARQRTP